QGWRVINAADFDDPWRGVDAHQARDADGAPAAAMDDGVDERIVAKTVPLQMSVVVLEDRERAIGQIGPVAPLLVEEVGSVEFRGMARWDDRFDGAKAALHRCPRRTRARDPVWQWKADRLPQLIDMPGLGHSSPQG